MLLQILILISCHLLVFSSETPKVVARTRHSSFIIGGRDAYPGEIPYQVSIQSKSNPGNHLCAGVIYDETHIISSASCLEFVALNGVVAAGSITISGSSFTRQIRGVQNILLHPGYLNRPFNNDFAIAVLNQSLELNEFVSPLRIPEVDLEDPVDGQNAVLTGWGDNGTHPSVDTLQVASVHVMDHQMCDSFFTDLGLPFVTETMMCTLGSNGEGACGGDGGGPVACTDQFDTKYLCGIVSWGVSPCSPHYPSVHANVVHLSEWLREVLPPQTRNS